jgi:hypothetical protein
MYRKRSKKIRQAARGQECQVRIPGICNFNPETTILAHRPGGPMGGKNPDYQGAFCCSSCHDAVDGRIKTKMNDAVIGICFYEGVFRTQEILREMGLLTSEE